MRSMEPEEGPREAVKGVGAGGISPYDDPRFVLKPSADKILRANAMNPERVAPETPTGSGLAAPVTSRLEREDAVSGVPVREPRALDALRQWVGFLSVLAAFIPFLRSALWLIHDFTRLSLTSPNLDKATQVADFDDFSYIGGYLLSSHFRPGLLLAMLAVTLLVLGAHLYQRQLDSRRAYWLGAIALLQLMALQWLDYHLLNLVLVVFVGAVLWLTTEWEEPAPTAVSDAGLASIESRHALRRVLSWLKGDRLMLVYSIATLLSFLVLIVRR